MRVKIHRGDIFHVDLDPIMGREQRGKRFVLIVSNDDFNQLGTPLVCPITQGGDFARSRGYAVSLSGLGLRTQGVILCNQQRTINIEARVGQFIEGVPDFIIDDVVERLYSILDDI